MWFYYIIIVNKIANKITPYSHSTKLTFKRPVMSSAMGATDPVLFTIKGTRRNLIILFIKNEVLGKLQKEKIWEK